MASANVLELGEHNWQSEVVSSTIPVLVDFWAPWCSPCRALNPTIDKVADQFAGKVKVGKVNTVDHEDLAARYGINYIPRLLIFKGGEQPVMAMGGTTEAELVKVLNKVLEG